ncbi:hypothetical protein ACI8AC_07580 [Geodermatophilus sp. SYSU D00758]
MPAVNRAARSAVAVLLLLSSTALIGCSAGQVTQTATQARDSTGGTGQVGDITIRAVQLVHPPGGVHEVGEQAQATMAIVNSGRVDDRLVDITGADFGAATVGTSPTTADPSSPGPDAFEAMALIEQPPTAETTAVDVLLPAGGAVFVGTSTPTVVLSGLTRRIDAAQSVELTLTFARAGQTTVSAITGPPSGVLPRGPAFDFSLH